MTIVIGIVGLKGSGKTTLANMFTEIGFKYINLHDSDTFKHDLNQLSSENFNIDVGSKNPNCGICHSSCCQNTNLKLKTLTESNKESTNFLLKKIFVDLSVNYVVEPIEYSYQLEALRCRSFFCLMHIEAPFNIRLDRLKGSIDANSLINEDDKSLYGCTSQINKCIYKRDLYILNDGPESMIRDQISVLKITAQEIIRPSPDRYFMKLAFLASTRSNCLKRRVGALIVKDRRIISTGYNGTPTGTINCFLGGCPRCSNIATSQGADLESCRCVHAEANALLEAGLFSTTEA